MVLSAATNLGGLTCLAVVVLYASRAVKFPHGTGVVMMPFSLLVSFLAMFRVRYTKKLQGGQPPQIGTN